MHVPEHTVAPCAAADGSARGRSIEAFIAQNRAGFASHGLLLRVEDDLGSSDPAQFKEGKLVRHLCSVGALPAVRSGARGWRAQQQ